MPAAQLNHVLPDLYLVLADGTLLSRFLHLAMHQFLDFLLAEALGDLADLVAQFQQLLSDGLLT